MEIMPNSTVKFLKNIPFDNDYNDTIYFDTLTNQYEYFSSDNFVKYTIDDNYYIRHSANVIDVDLKLKQTIPSVQISTAESLFDCNYMMFNNFNFRKSNGDYKWFYAFITDVEYVNNEVARVTFEIDVMQTWMFDYELEECFIEREHSATDEVGDNVVPENLELGYETICRERIEIPIDTDSIILVADKNPDGSDVTAITITNYKIPITLSVNRYDMTTTAGSNKFLADMNAYLKSTLTNLSPEDILYVCVCPKFINNDRTYAQNAITSATNNRLKIRRPTQIGGYDPKNNKLFTYPYCFVTLSNRQGINMTYKFEYFGQEQSGTSDHIARFVLGGESLYIPSVCMYPYHYRPIQRQGSTSTDLTEGIEYGIVIADFPQLATVGDTFKAWWAQNQVSFVLGTVAAEQGAALQMASGAISMGMSEGTGGSGSVSGGLSSSISTISSAIGKVFDTQNMPPQTNGLTNMSYLLFSAGAFGYTLMTKTINTQQARIIDNYFSMFGYATHRVKKPNTHVREAWTYTKTIGCTIKGKTLPSKYQEKICAIFNHGVRFWVAGKVVGNYSQDNNCL